MTGIHGRLTRRLAPTVVAGLVLTTGLVAAPADASPVEPAFPPRAEASTTLDVDEAMARARAGSVAVQATGATTATDTVTANPDGTLTLTTATTPVRAKVGRGWSDLDPMLRRNADGSLSPKVATEGLRLSAGGTGAMITMSGAGLAAEVLPPMRLPAPEILVEDQTTAVYREVLPGVDLRIRTTSQGGFSQVFVVHSAAAAAQAELAALNLPTRLTGVTLAADAAGNITGNDRTGRTVLTAPAPLMWDSTPAAATRTDQAGVDRDAITGRIARSTARGPGSAARTASVATTVRDGAIKLTPDRELLTGKSTRYPVYIDPTFTWSSTGSKNNGWASVAKNFPNTNYWKNTPDPYGRMQVGNPGDIWSRTFINFPIPVSTLAGATIHEATMSITETKAYSCTASRVNIYAPATTLSSSNATWNYWNSQSLGSVLDYKNVAHGYNSNCPAAGVSFNVKTAITANVAANKKTQTFALTGVDEQADLNSWKEFLETSPTLQIKYNHKPSQPTGLTTAPRTSCDGSTTIGDGSITLYAPVSDRNAGTLGVAFKLWKDGSAGTILAQTSASTTTYSSGSTAVFPIPVSILRQAAGGSAKKFHWNVQTSDFNLSSDPTQCSFWFDPTRPGTPRVDQVSDSDAKIGQSVQISVHPPCIPNVSPCQVAQPVPASYLYQVNGQPYRTVAATAGEATFMVFPGRFTNTVTVTALSAVGNAGETTAAVTFNATAPDQAMDGDFDGDNITDLVVAGGSYNLASGLWFTGGKKTGGLEPAATNLGANGVGSAGTGQPQDFNGTQIVTGRFFGEKLQDALAYVPPGAPAAAPAGSAVMLRGNGDGSIIQAQLSNTTQPLQAGTFSDQFGTDPKSLANAGHQSSADFPDLVGISGPSPTGAYYLTYMPSSDGIGFNAVEMLPGVLTPTGGTDWDTWQLTSAEIGTRTSLILWQKNSGKLYLWDQLTWSAGDGVGSGTGGITFTQYLLSPNWNGGQAIMPRAADINGDGTADLWSIGANAAATAWLTTNLAGGTGTVTAQPQQRVLTGTHAWMLNDFPENQLNPNPVIAKDSIGIPALNATGAGGAKWKSGNLFNPDVEFNGTLANLTTTSQAVVTNADFTVSAWVQAESTGGTVLSQDGSSTAGFKVWADPSNNSWRFGLAATNSSSTGWNVAAGPAGSFRPGAWTHLSASYKASTGVMDLHVDEVDVATATHLNPWNATGPFRIGSHRTASSSVAGYLKGQVAEVVTYNQVIIYDQGNKAVWDFDGDLKPDVMAMNSAGELFLFRGNGASGFRSGGGNRIGTGWGAYTAAFTVRDFDGDKMPDIIARKNTGELFLHRGNGAGAWATGAGINIGSGWNSYVSIFSPGDFSGDGKADVIARKSDGKLMLFRGDGVGGWFNPSGTEFSSGWSPYNAVISPGDFSGDDKPDIVGRTSDGKMVLFRGNGAGALQTGNGTEFGTGWGTYNVVFSNGDFSGDAKPDIMGREPNGEIYISRGNGLGAWQSGSRTNVGTGWQSFTLIF